MSENQISPVSSAERIEILDVLRGLAIGGILIGNMQWFSGYGMMPPALAAQTSFADQMTHFLVHFFIEGKFYSIFSFLFGFGFALQIARAEERGDLQAALFKRRLGWLLVIGLLHAYLLWAGDILSIYAVMGFVLILFRRKSDEALLKWAFALMVVPIVTYILLYILFVVFVPPEAAASFTGEAAQRARWNEGVKMVTQGGYLQVISGFNLQYIVGRYAGLILEMRLPKILAMFLLGFYAYRRGFFQNLASHQTFIRRVLVYGLVLGLVGNIAFAVLAGKEAVIPPTAAGIAGVVAYAFGVPALALFYIALVATMWQTRRQGLALLAPVGRMALTNYILQTVVCVVIFYGYGFGHFGSFGALAATLTALAIFLFQIVLSALWLKYFAYGPLEWIWRQLTYGQRLGLRRKSRPTAMDTAL
jgi:uncharacterized protein